MATLTNSVPFRVATRGAAFAVLALGLASCNGGSRGETPGNPSANGVTLTDVAFGRLADIYAYRRVDESITDRRVAENRVPTLIAEDVVVDPGITTEPLIDAEGNSLVSSSFRLMPFDPTVGHTELLILWDDRIDGESERFDDALSRASTGLTTIPGAFRGQNTVVRPIPVVPRDAAIRLRFNQPLGVTSSFFRTNPSAAQLLLLSDDPSAATDALSPLPARIIARNNTLIIDPTIAGQEILEATVGFASGLPSSLDNQTANIRIALPVTGAGVSALRVAQDSIAQFNGIGVAGEAAVIRDFRAANLADGVGGLLPDDSSPTLITDADLGIVNVDTSGILTIAKRGRNLALRGRIPFVDGGRDPDTGLPGGPTMLPTRDRTGNTLALPSGDLVITQAFSVPDPRDPAETLVVSPLRAEIIEVLEVDNVADSLADLGLTPTDTDGGELEFVRVRVPGLRITNSLGQPSDFSGVLSTGAGPEGVDCTVRARYYEFIPYRFGSAAVTDGGRRNEFVRIDQPVDPNLGQNPPVFMGATTVTNVDPTATVELAFSEPLDFDRTDSSENVLVTNSVTTVANISDALESPKQMSLSLIASRLVAGGTSGIGDNSRVEIVPILGLFHEQGQEEEYWLHLPLGMGSIADLAGNGLRLFDERDPASSPVQSFSIRMRMDSTDGDNLVVSRVIRFASTDEDGTDVSQNAVDMFGQFQINNGNLVAAATTRRRLVADATQLSTVERFTHGECVDDMGFIVPGPLGSLLYPSFPGFSFTINVPPTVFQPPPPAPPGPLTYGGVTEPLTRVGSRAMLTYREDDFGLGYSDAADFNIDVEQLHWASWQNGDIEFDNFGRVSVGLSHSDKRPDILLEWATPAQMVLTPDMGMCDFNCKSFLSGLSTTFLANVLNGSEQVDVVSDRAYQISPAFSFTATTGTLFHPYPEFQQTYTWRDSRIVSWDPVQQRPIGLGGARDASGGPGEGSDATASITSPWITDEPDNAAPRWIDEVTPTPPLPPPPVFFRDRADFLGDRSRDHDPIALPLLVDLRFFPEDTGTGETGTPANEMHTGLALTPLLNGAVSLDGYYGYTVPGGGSGFMGGGGIGSGVPFACNNFQLPFFRIHTTGGFNPTTGETVLVNPDLQTVAQTSIIKNAGFGDAVNGVGQVPPGDTLVPWAAIDLVRRVSVITGGFFDTLEPHRNEVTGIASIPNLTASPELGADADEFTVVLDPPLPLQPAGTALEVEFRGIQDLQTPVPWAPFMDDSFDTRGNLLNPNYACEAFRYAGTNLGAKPGLQTPRLTAPGITPYASTGNLMPLAQPNGKLPRFLNFRISMENNLESNPIARPFLRSMSIVYRLR